MSVIYLIIIGAAAGFLATRIMKIEAGILPTIGIGIAGALIGGLVLQVLLTTPLGGDSLKMEKWHLSELQV